MRGGLSRTKAVILLTGVLMVVLGIAVLVNPLGAVETLVRLMGWMLAGYGVVTLVAAFMRGDPVRNAPVELGLGILTLIAGLVMGIWPRAFTSFVWTFIGVLILVTGVLDVIEAGSYRRVRSPLAVPATVSGAITVLLGVLVIAVPLASATLGMLVAAVALLIDGVTEIIFGLGI